eukprot:m.198651 g.198651  ORF g.198651 m.198651 type:complete len:1731 (+) comp25895_c0_seq24:30-5222(+)
MDELKQCAGCDEWKTKVNVHFGALLCTACKSFWQRHANKKTTTSKARQQRLDRLKNLGLRLPASSGEGRLDYAAKLSAPLKVSEVATNVNMNVHVDNFSYNSSGSSNNNKPNNGTGGTNSSPCLQNLSKNTNKHDPKSPHHSALNSHTTTSNAKTHEAFPLSSKPSDLYKSGIGRYIPPSTAPPLFIIEPYADLAAYDPNTSYLFDIEVTSKLRLQDCRLLQGQMQAIALTCGMTLTCNCAEGQGQTLILHCAVQGNNVSGSMLSAALNDKLQGTFTVGDAINQELIPTLLIVRRDPELVEYLQIALIARVNTADGCMPDEEEVSRAIGALGAQLEVGPGAVYEFVFAVQTERNQAMIGTILKIPEGQYDPNLMAFDFVHNKLKDVHCYMGIGSFEIHISEQEFHDRFSAFHKKPLNQLPNLDWYRMLAGVNILGGYTAIKNNRRSWQLVLSVLRAPPVPVFDALGQLKRCYDEFVLPFDIYTRLTRVGGKRAFRLISEQYEPTDLSTIQSHLLLDVLKSNKQKLKRSREEKLVVLGRGNLGRSFLISSLVLATECAPDVYPSTGWQAKEGLHQLYEDYVVGLDADMTPLSFERWVVNVTFADSDAFDVNGCLKNQALLREENLLHDHVSAYATHGKLFSSCDLLLPSSPIGHNMHTFPIRLRFGRCYHVVVKYYDRDEFLEPIRAFWRQHFGSLSDHAEKDNNITSDGVRWRCSADLAAASPAAMLRSQRLLLMRIRGSTAHEDNLPKVFDIETYLRPNDELEQMFGKQVVYVGKGRSVFDDRVFIKRALRKIHDNELTNVGIEDICVYCPSFFLEKGLQVIDPPASDDSNPLRLLTLDVELSNCSSILWVVERNVARAHEDAAALKRAKVPERYQRGKLALRVVLLQERAFPLTLQTTAHPQSVFNSDNKHLLPNTFGTMLAGSDAKDFLQEHVGTNVSLPHPPCHAVYPLLCLSSLMQMSRSVRGDCKKFVGSKLAILLREGLRKSTIPELLASIMSLGLASGRDFLKSLRAEITDKKLLDPPETLCSQETSQEQQQLLRNIFQQFAGRGSSHLAKEKELFTKEMGPVTRLLLLEPPLADAWQGNFAGLLVKDLSQLKQELPSVIEKTLELLGSESIFSVRRCFNVALQGHLHPVVPIYTMLKQVVQQHAQLPLLHREIMARLVNLRLAFDHFISERLGLVFSDNHDAFHQKFKMQLHPGLQRLFVIETLAVEKICSLASMNNLVMRLFSRVFSETVLTGMQGTDSRAVLFEKFRSNVTQDFYGRLVSTVIAHMAVTLQEVVADLLQSLPQIFERLFLLSLKQLCFPPTCTSAWSSAATQFQTLIDSENMIVFRMCPLNHPQELSQRLMMHHMVAVGGDDLDATKSLRSPLLQSNELVNAQSFLEVKLRPHALLDQDNLVSQLGLDPSLYQCHYMGGNPSVRQLLSALLQSLFFCTRRPVRLTQHEACFALMEHLCKFVLSLPSKPRQPLFDLSSDDVLRALCDALLNLDAPPFEDRFTLILRVLTECYGKNFLVFDIDHAPLLFSPKKSDPHSGLLPTHRLALHGSVCIGVLLLSQPSLSNLSAGPYAQPPVVLTQEQGAKHEGKEQRHDCHHEQQQEQPHGHAHRNPPSHPHTLTASPTHSSSTTDQAMYSDTSGSLRAALDLKLLPSFAQDTLQPHVLPHTPPAVCLLDHPEPQSTSLLDENQETPAPFDDLLLSNKDLLQSAVTKRRTESPDSQSKRRRSESF